MSAMAKPMWASMLAKLVAPMDSERAAKAVAGMMPMLSLPDEAFTVESVRAVCSRGQAIGFSDKREYVPLTRVPTFGELEAALGRWWYAKVERELIKAAPVAREALSAPPKEAPSPQACEHVSSLVKQFQAERSHHVSGEISQKPKIKLCHLSTEQLAEQYKRIGIPNPRGDQA